jgi:hypothetical protein
MDSTTSSDAFELRHAATDHVTTVTVPTRRLFAITGFGPPRSSDFSIAMGSLAAVDAILRDTLRRRGAPPIIRPAPEVLWTPGPETDLDDLAAAFSTRAGWRWEQLAAIPAAAAPADIDAAIEMAQRGAGRPQPLIHAVTVSEGAAMQLLQLGGPAKEAETLGRLLAALVDAGLAVHGPVHQLYLSGVDTIATDRQRSILRVPVAPAAA